MFAEVSGIHKLESTVGHEIYHNVLGVFMVLSWRLADINSVIHGKLVQKQCVFKFLISET